MTIHLYLFMWIFFKRGVFALLAIGPICLSAQERPAFPAEAILSCLHEIYSNNFPLTADVCDLPKEYAQVQSLLGVFSQRWEDIPVHLSSEDGGYLKKLQQVVTQFEIADRVDPVTNYLRITAQLLLAEYYFANHDFLQAMWHSKKAYPLILQSIDEGRTEPEYLFVTGLYFYYIEYYKDKSFFYRSALWPFRSGNKEKALELLKKSIEDKSMARTEALIYLAHIHLRLENNPTQALIYSKELAENYPSNAKFRELYIDNLLAAEKYEECYPLLVKQTSLDNPYFTIPAYYFMGCYYREAKGENEKATLNFNKCLQLVETHKLLYEYKERAEAQMVGE